MAHVRVYLVFVLVFIVAVARGVITPNDFESGSDSERIEAAIAKAVASGTRSIEIPRLNAKSGEAIWLIERAIMLPSDFTLVLRDSLVRLAPGTQDNIIRNAGTLTTPMTPNQNIRIIGIGNATLSGGLKAHFDPPGDKSGWPTIGILLWNTKHFTIENFAMQETQAWAISVEHGCAFGRIANIAFNSSNMVPNQDGVDIRKGCHDILIENITGGAGDDVVALTGLRNDKPPADPTKKRMQIGGVMPNENDDIYNITIRNVIAKCTGGHGIIRLLNQDGIRMYNIVIRDVIDSSAPGERRVQAAVRIGDAKRYSSIRAAEMGEMFNIVVDNVMTRGVVGVTIRGPLKDARLNNIVGFDGCTNLVQKIAPVENVLFNGDSL